MFNFGLLELIIVAVFAAILYGTVKLAELSQNISRSAKKMRAALPSFKASGKKPREVSREPID